MRSSQATHMQDIATVGGVFLLVCGVVLVVAHSSPPTTPQRPAALQQAAERARKVTAAVEAEEYDRAAREVEALCSSASLEGSSPSQDSPPASD